MKQLKLPNVRPLAPTAERDSSPGSRTGRQLMSSLLNEDERALRDAVRSFLDRKVAPLVAEHERARTFPWELLPQLYDFGYVRGGVPEAAGGDALPMIMQAILMEEAGRCWGSLRTTVNVQGMVARVLARPPTRARRNVSSGRCRGPQVPAGSGSPSRTRARTPARCAPPPGGPGTASWSTAASSTSPTPSAAIRHPVRPAGRGGRHRPRGDRPARRRGRIGVRRA